MTPLCHRSTAFPDEEEFLYPPGTYLRLKEGSTSTREKVLLKRHSSRGGMLSHTANVTIVDVEPFFPTV